MSIPAVAPVVSSLRSIPANGHASFVPQIRKLVFEYCDRRTSSAPVRDWIWKHVETLAVQNPHVEIVVKQRAQRQPIVRGLYMNNRDKVVALNGHDHHTIQTKVQLLLDASGAKIVPLKRKTVQSMTESARGIWSGLHVPEPIKI